MAGSFNRVAKANVRLFVPVLELHRDVKFDLFHGNWPYTGDLLFVAKNYPNVALNLTWLYVIDPIYAQQLLERAVMTVPHSKIHGFGGDHLDMPERALAHLKLAKHVIAAALANLVESDGWPKSKHVPLPDSGSSITPIASSPSIPHRAGRD